jgi:hypothetical protein
VRTSPSDLRIAGALTAIGATFALGSTEAAAQGADVLAAQRTRAELELALGQPPERCIPSTAGRELCQWALGDRDPAWKALARSIDTRARVIVLCELPAGTSARAPGSCSVYPRESNHSEWAFPNLHPTRRGDASVADRRAARERVSQRAAAELAQARTLLELSGLVGAAPDQCVSAGPGMRSCLWRATSRTLGHGLLAATIEAPSRKKVRLECRLPDDGAARAADSCKVEIGS